MIVRWSARPPPRLAAAKIEATARPEPMPRPLPGLLFASPLSGYYPRTNGFCNGFDDKIDLCFGKLGKHRQREKLVRDLFRDRERATLMTQADVSPLKMHWDRVMYAAADAFLFQPPHHFIAVLHTDGVDVVDMASVFGF